MMAWILKATAGVMVFAVAVGSASGCGSPNGDTEAEVTVVESTPAIDPREVALTAVRSYIEGWGTYQGVYGPADPTPAVQCAANHVEDDPDTTAAFASTDDQAFIEWWLALPMLLADCVEPEIFYDLDLYDATPAERSCLAAKIAADPDIVTYIAASLGSPSHVTTDTTVLIANEPQFLRGASNWREVALYQCLLTASLAASAAEYGIVVADRPDTDAEGRACLTDHFMTLSPDAIETYRQFTFSQKRSADVRSTEYWVVQQQLLTACHLVDAGVVR
jgi:hypothetical protein